MAESRADIVNRAPFIPAGCSVDDGVDGFFSALGCDGWVGACSRAQHFLADAQGPAEARANLGKPVFFFLDVVPDVLDQRRRLSVEPLISGFQRGELDDQHVGHVMFIVGLKDVVLQLGEKIPHPGYITSFAR